MMDEVHAPHVVLVLGAAAYVALLAKSRPMRELLDLVQFDPD